MNIHSATGPAALVTLTGSWQNVFSLSASFVPGTHLVLLTMLYDNAGVPVDNPHFTITPPGVPSIGDREATRGAGNKHLLSFHFVRAHSTTGAGLYTVAAYTLGGQAWKIPINGATLTVVERPS